MKQLTTIVNSLNIIARIVRSITTGSSSDEHPTDAQRTAFSIRNSCPLSPEAFTALCRCVAEDIERSGENLTAVNRYVAAHNLPPQETLAWLEAFGIRDDLQLIERVWLPILERFGIRNRTLRAD